VISVFIAKTATEVFCLTPRQWSWKPCAPWILWLC